MTFLISLVVYSFRLQQLVISVITVFSLHSFSTMLLIFIYIAHM